MSTDMPRSRCHDSWHNSLPFLAITSKTVTYRGMEQLLQNKSRQDLRKDKKRCSYPSLSHLSLSLSLFLSLFLSRWMKQKQKQIEEKTPFLKMLNHASMFCRKKSGLRLIISPSLSLSRSLWLWYTHSHTLFLHNSAPFLWAVINTARRAI